MDREKLQVDDRRAARLIQAAILAGLTVAVFSPTLSAGFVYDARLQILTDGFLHEPANWGNVLTLRVLSMDVLDFNRPVHLASLMLDAALWGRNPFGYHLTSILLHAANAVLVWLLVQDVLQGDQAGDSAAPGRSITAFLAALLFAVHPVVVEAVCEPTFREDLLAAAFTLGAVVLATRHAASGGGRDVRQGIACATCCLLAVASKESGVVAPFVLAADRWLCRGRGSSRFWGVAIGGGFALAAAFLAARFLLEPSPSRIFEARPAYPGGSFTEAMRLEPRILALYSQLIVFPVNLCADYGLYSMQHLPLWAAAIVLAGIVALGFIASRRDRRVLFGVSLVLLPLLPVSNVVPIYRAAADRYLYLPMAGVACIVACVLDRATAAGPQQRRQAVLIGTMAAVAALAAACVGRQGVWGNQLALWEDTFRRNPVSWTAASGYSAALREAGRNDEAVVLAARAVELSNGGRGESWLALALALDAAGRTAEADTAATKAVEVDGRLADPDARVAVLAMEREEAEAAKRVLARIR